MNAEVDVLPLECDVVIVNYNAGHWLAKCVTSAFASGASRVIVVDNASVDDSLDQMLSIPCASDQLVVIRNARNLGFAAACNIGVRAALSPAVLFLNPDCVLAPNALVSMLDILNSAEKIGMVGGHLRNLDGSEQAGGRRAIPDPRSAFTQAFGLSRLSRWFPRIFGASLLHTQNLPAHPCAVDAISGACMLVKAAAIDHVGLWDEGYFLHCEDLDWCMRFKLLGWQIMFVPVAKVSHARGACSHSRPVFVEWHKHRGMLLFYQKFYRQRYSSLLWGAVVVGVWARFFVVAARGVMHRLLAKAGGQGA